jgi:DNA-binding CsgD family transcriptional regulator
MDQHQDFNPSKDNEHDFVFIVPSIGLLDDKKWLYIQKYFYLTDRELQVAKLVCRGFNNEDIAAKLKIKPGTIKTHIRNIYRRIRVKNKIQMVLKFVDVAAKFSARSGTTSAIPIVEIEKSDKKTSASSNILNEE